MLADALKRRARNAFLGHSDTLRIMMGQHHELEENVVFPIIDRALSRRRQDILKAMHEYCDKSALAQQEN
jgi:hemerythrin-like domain-containing protein